jgi:hypothetical protein
MVEHSIEVQKYKYKQYHWAIKSLKTMKQIE